ncbi:MAG: TIGR01777 family oxidoreductase [Acidimicrobiales bacterium]
MDIAITGSTGFIGEALVADLVGNGHRVARLVRPGSNATSGETISWDPRAGSIDAAGLEGVDGIVHLAGEGIETRRWSTEQKARILDSRTNGTTLLTRTIEQLDRPPAVWLSGSAVGFYGDRGDEPVDESAEPGDDFLADVCQRWEGAAQTGPDTRLVYLRTGIVLDATGGALAAQLPFFKFGLGGRIGDGRQFWSWISLADEVAAIGHLLTADVDGPVNLTAPNPVTNAEFTTTLGRVLGRPTILPTPRLAVNARLGRELAEALLFTSARVQPTVLEESGFEFRHRELDAALRDTLEK